MCVKGHEQEASFQAGRNQTYLDGARYLDSSEERMAGKATLCVPR